MVAKRWVPWCAALVVMLSACASGEGDDTGQPTTSAASATSSSTMEPATTSTVPIATTFPITTSSTSTTVIPTSTTLSPIAALDPGLFCRDLAALGYGYSDAVAYWTRERSPERMDADRNGIPCETVYQGDDVRAWGDPLPTTTTIGVWYSAGIPEYHVAPIPGSGGLYGSGCSPGPGALPDGIWFGAIAARTVEALEFDLMCFSPGPEGPGDVSNASTSLRTVPVAQSAFVHTILDGPRGVEWTYEDYPVWLMHSPHPLCGTEGCLVWLYVNDGAVTEITELFFA